MSYYSYKIQDQLDNVESYEEFKQIGARAWHEDIIPNEQTGQLKKYRKQREESNSGVTEIYIAYLLLFWDNIVKKIIKEKGNSNLQSSKSLFTKRCGRDKKKFKKQMCSKIWRQLYKSVTSPNNILKVHDSFKQLHDILGGKKTTAGSRIVDTLNRNNLLCFEDLCNKNTPMPDTWIKYFSLPK